METIEDVMLDLAWRRFSDIWQDKRELESKAGILLASNGVLLGFVANAWNNLDHWLALAGVAFLWLSATFCVFALKPRKYKEFDLKDAWNKYCKYFHDVSLLKRAIYSTLKEWEEINAKNVEDISKWYSWSVRLFLVAMTLIILALFSSFLQIYKSQLFEDIFHVV